MLPNLVVIGAMKCATTSLHYYLDLHPEISMSNPKELNFFTVEANWNRGAKWYTSHFESEQKIRGESSTSYSKYPVHRGVPERMWTLIPEAKLIYAIRNPIDRIVSHYVHNFSKRAEKRSLDEALSGLENSPYVHYSRYATQLRQFLGYFPEKNIHLVTLEELKTDQRSTLAEVFRFLDVDDGYWCDSFSVVRNRTCEKRRRNWLGSRLSSVRILSKVKPFLPSFIARSYPYILSRKARFKRPTLSKHLEEAIKYVLREDITDLRSITGKRFESWNI